MRPLSAAEALSALLWQPYECRSPTSLARSATLGALAGRARDAAGSGRGGQSPTDGRHACASPAALSDMRLPVPAPAPLRKSDSVCVRVPGETSPDNVNIVYVERCADTNQSCNSAVQTSERSVASAECQTEEPRRRRRRRTRGCRAPPPPPPYCTLPPPPLGSPPLCAQPLAAPPPLGVVQPPPLVPGPPPAPGVAPHPASQRFPFHPIPLRLGRGGLYLCSEEVNAPKSCCGRPPLRLCGLFLGVVGACLVAAGAVLGALRPQPRAPLTLLLLMIGIGIVLVTAAGVAWRLGGRDAPCLFLGVRRSSCRRLVPRMPPSYARPHHPYAAMLYPEFQYRPPPPTYQASMQDYRLRLLLQDRCVPAVSPPPTYSSNTASLVSRGTTSAAQCGSDYSHGPPSYTAPRPSLPSSDDVTVTAIHDKYEQPIPDTITQEKDPDSDVHLVTIVHTDAQPVIVTVSGSINDTHIQPTSEIDILAHL